MVATNVETVWEMRGEIWAKTWATREEDDWPEETDRPEDREGWPKDREEDWPEDREEDWPEDREEDWPEDREKDWPEDREEDWPDKREEVWPATAKETVWETRGWIWARIADIRADWSREEPEDWEDPEELEVVDDPKDSKEDPEEEAEDPGEIEEGPDGREGKLEETNDEAVELLGCSEEETDDTEVGLAVICTNPGSSVLSSV